MNVLKPRKLNNFFVKNVAILFLALTGFLSCKNDPLSKYLIPRDTFREILVDIYLVDGYYMTSYNNSFHHTDTSNLYHKILKKYGYNRANFDSTLKHYTLRPKKFDELYDEVITQLNKLQQETSLLQQYEADSSRNLYKKKTKWSIPKDGNREMIPFEVPIKDTGMYTIVVQLKLFEDDEAEEPRLTAYFLYKDDKKKEHIEYFPTIPYKKTNRFVVITANQRNKNKKMTHIKGWVMNHSNRDKNFKKHAEVRSIIVARN
jgi:hypothetical protein